MQTERILANLSFYAYFWNFNNNPKKDHGLQRLTKILLSFYDFKKISEDFRDF